MLLPKRRVPILARDVMSAPPLTIGEKEPVREAARRMCEARVGSILVVDQKGRLTGIVTERDILCLCGREGAGDAPVWTVMTENPVTVAPDTPVDEVLEKMSNLGVRHIPVVDKEGKPLGVISVRDVLSILRLLARLLA